MKNLTTILGFSLAAFFLAFIHLLLIRVEFIQLDTKQLFIAHASNFTISIICTLTLVFISWFKKHLGFSFFLCGVFKMLLLMFYLTYRILLFQKDENFVLQFVAVYFIYLIFDSYFAIRSLKQSS